MKTFLLELMYSLVPDFVRKPLLAVLANPYAVRAYSQEGEDLILGRIFEGRREGFYVDVGAHHPFRFSNTYRFYELGWRGVNIDAMPGSMTRFRKHRPEDINLEVPIALQEHKMTFYSFNDPALNTFDAAVARERAAIPGYKVVKEFELQAVPLAKILGEHLPAGRKIDFMSVDAEGLDLEILKSNDWEKYSPEVVLVEVLTGEADMASLSGNGIAEFLAGKGYTLYAKAVKTCIFRKRTK